MDKPTANEIIDAFNVKLHIGRQLNSHFDDPLVQKLLETKAFAERVGDLSIHLGLCLLLVHRLEELDRRPPF